MTQSASVGTSPSSWRRLDEWTRQRIEAALRSPDPNITIEDALWLLERAVPCVKCGRPATICQGDYDIIEDGYIRAQQELDRRNALPPEPEQRLEKIKAILAVEWRLQATQGIHHDHLSDLAFLIVELEFWKARAAAVPSSPQEPTMTTSTGVMLTVERYNELMDAENEIGKSAIATIALWCRRWREQKDRADAAEAKLAAAAVPSSPVAEEQ